MLAFTQLLEQQPLFSRTLGLVQWRCVFMRGVVRPEVRIPAERRDR
jgi:hypothetical protein